MTKQERANIIQLRLNNLYPIPKIPLYHLNEFTLLIAVILSAQSTDKKVNELTHDLFIIANTAEDMYNLGEEKILQHIKQIGIAKQKAKYIYRTSKILLDKFKGKVPSDFKNLETLPGVGHKTASVVMAQAFGIATFPVDTHIHRLSQRWGLSKGRNVNETELDLKKIFPISDWNKLHLQFIYYGREFCTARGCNGTICNICRELFPNRKKPFIHYKAS